MTNHDLDNAAKVLGMVQLLTANEGDSVRFFNRNPDFGGPDCTIMVSEAFGVERQFFGETVLDCLREAWNSR